MANTIKLKSSSVPGKVPTTTDLQLRELGVNTTDGKLYLKKSVAGVESIVEVTGAGGGGATGGGSDAVFHLSDQIVLNNYSIPTGKNALTVGPLSVANSVEVIVSENSRLVIL